MKNSQLGFLASLMVAFIVSLDATNLSWVTAVGRETISFYSHIRPLPIIGIFFPDLSVSDALALMQAFVIIGVPIFIMKQAMATPIFKNPRLFFANRANWFWFAFGVAALGSVFWLEWKNMVISATSQLDLTPCDPTIEPLCDLAKDLERIERANKEVENAKTYAGFVSSLNLVLATATARILNSTTHRIQEA